MKLNLAIPLAAVAVLFTVQATPVSPNDAEAAGIQAASRKCCKYAGSGQWCGPQGCCLWNECLQYGGPAQCGYAGCCMKWRC
ncbi:hypothetical protein BGW41_006383 [Actinomortierella wolfii]|nr:hypothetical protein BGW41_006383 [Actinomortierella wolfii]